MGKGSLGKPEMRVAVCSSGAGHVFRGVEAWTFDMAEVLFQNGVKCHLFVGAGSPTKPYQNVLWCLKRTSLVNKVLVKILKNFGGWRYGFGIENHLEELSFVLPLIFELRKTDVDIVHTHEFQLASTLQWLNKRGILNAKVVFGHVTNESNEALMKFPFVQHVSVVDMEKRRRQGCFKKTWTTIPNFVDTNKFRPVGKAAREKLRKKYGFPIENPIILTVAAIKREHKRIDWLIDEMVHLKNLNSDFLWVVVGGKEHETEEIVSEGIRALGQNVRFFVDLKRKILPEIYQCSDIFVLGSLREMFGIVLVEAMSSGLITVVHDDPVLKYVVGETGVVEDLTKSGIISEVICSILNDRNIAQKMSTVARKRVVDNFSKSAVLKRILNYYMRILSTE